jgi:hypothetical protein
MKKISVVIVSLIVMLISNSCGVDGDPGHCYFSLDWEYWNDDYGVYFYEDDNPDVPEVLNLEPNVYYDCYPGSYDYSYESEDYEYWYTYKGTYTLVQNLGTSAHLFEDGLDGVDTSFELYLFVYARKALQADPTNSSKKMLENSRAEAMSYKPEAQEEYEWEETNEGWTMKVTQVVSKYRKVQ